MDDQDNNMTNPNNDLDIISPTSIPTNHTKLLDSLSLASTMTTEKRSAKREQSLRNLFKSITQYATFYTGKEIILSKLNDTIIPFCIYGLRGGVASPSEQYASCRVLEATAVVIGGDQDDYCDIVYDILVKIVKATGRAAVVRGAALRALSMAYFVCCSDSSGTDAILDLCENVASVQYRGEDVNPNLRAIALDCWALLSTTLHGVYISGDEHVGGLGEDGRGIGILPLLNDCLDHANLNLRSSAGECITLIHEARLDIGLDEDEVENTTERKFRRGSWDGSEVEDLIDEIRHRVTELSVESGRHMSKKDKKAQRATFREFSSTILDDESPNEIVTFRGGTLHLKTWKEIVQLNFIRHCLQSGFQIQLMTNETLQLIFGADASTLNTNATMSQLEKRLTMSKTSDASKAADREMLKRRKSKRNKQDHFLTIDGEDI